MKVIICTYSNYPEGLGKFVEYTNKLKQYYCDKYGIEYCFKQDSYLKDSKTSWNKVFLLKQLFDKNEYDWIIWMDADCAPVNMNFNIVEYLEHEQKKIIIRKDINNFNSGVVAIPNNEISQMFLNNLLSRSNEQKYQYGWKQQQAMIDYFRFTRDWKQPKNEIGFNEYPYQNIPNKYKQNESWVVHLPNMSEQYKNNYFKQIIKKVFPEQIENEIDNVSVKIVSEANKQNFENKEMFVDSNDVKIYKKYSGNFYKNISLLLTANDKKILKADFIGNMNKNFLLSDVEIIDYKSIFQNYDIILPRHNIKRSVLNFYIENNLLNDRKEQIITQKNFVNEFESVFDSEQIDLLLFGTKTYFHFLFIMKQNMFDDFMNYFKEKLKLFKQSKILKQFVKDSNKDYGFCFAELVLNAYCYKNKLKVYEKDIIWKR